MVVNSPNAKETSSSKVLHNGQMLADVTILRDVVLVLNVSVSRRSRDVFWNVSVLSRSERFEVVVHYVNSAI